MSTPDDAELLRSVTREVLADLLPELLSEALTTNGNGHHPGNGARPHAGPGPASEDPGTVPGGGVPQVPAPPIAAVHRPSGWRPPAESDTTTASAAPAVAQDAAGATVERVDLRSDADLDAFVRSLVHRLENPRDRMAIRSGRLRFRLGTIAAAAAAAAAARRTGHGRARDAGSSGARSPSGRCATPPRPEPAWCWRGGRC